MRLSARTQSRLVGSFAVGAIVALAFAAVIAIAEGGYRPERYTGWFDPVKFGMIASFVGLFSTFASWVVFAAANRDKGARLASLVQILPPVGLTIIAGAVLVVLLSTPAGTSALVVSAPAEAGLRIGFGLLVLGVAPAAIVDIWGRLKERDPATILATLFLVVVLVFWIMPRL